MKSLSAKMLLRFLIPFCMIMSIGSVANAQCTLSPGDLVFTAYNALDDGNGPSGLDDSFSFLLLKDVSAGQVIYFTDLGWTDALAFQTADRGRSDAVIRWTADVNYPAGTELIITCKYTLTAKDFGGTTRGTVAIQQESYNTATLGVSPAEHMSLAEINADQIFAFTGSIAAPTFLAGISINGNPTTPWAASLAAGTTDAASSRLPAQLSAGAQNLGIAYRDPGDPTFPAAPGARYIKTTPAVISGSPAVLLAAINDKTKWFIQNDGNPLNPLLTAETYTVSGVSITTQPADRFNLCPGTGTTFVVNATNVCGYQWQVSTDGGTLYNNITNGGVYSGATTATLTISSVTGLNNNKYRVALTGSGGSNSNPATLTLLNPTLVFNTTTVAAGVYNTAYLQNINISSGGNGTYTYSLFSGVLPTGITLNPTSGTLSGAPTLVGTFNFTIRATDGCATPNNANQNYTLVISKADQTITYTLAAKTYGDVPYTLPATSSSGLTISYASSNPAVATITGNTVTIVGAGTSNITATQAGNTNYNAAPDVTQTLNVAAKAITLSLNATPLISKTYDNTTTATLAPANYTLNGLVGSDAVMVTGTAAYNTKDAGTGKTITINTFVLAGAQKDNYNLTTTSASTTGSITALPLSLTLNALPLVTKTYNNTTTATLAAANYTLNGILGTDAVTVSGTANYNTKDAGIGKTITANTFVLAGAQKDNYTLSTTTATTTGDITALSVSLALNATPLITKAYDNTTTATLAAANYTLTGILGADAVTVSGTANYDTKETGTGKTITANTFVLAGAQKDNYSLATTTATTTGNITARPLTLALNATPLITKAYDNTTTATLAAANYTLTGILGTDAVTVTGSATYNTKDAGTGKTITANTFLLAGAQKDNYSLSTTTATTTGNITAIPVTLALNATPVITKAYDNTTTAALASGNYALTGILGADAVTVTGAANYDTKDVGTAKTITANTFVLAGAQKDNYTLSTTSATTTGNITASALTLTLNAAPLITKAYDNTTAATLAAANYNLSGVLGADDVTVTGTANYNTKDAGTGKTITANTFVLSGAQKDNYSLSTTTATTTGNITAIPLTLALNATPVITKTYNNTTTAALAAANYALTGILGTDAVTVTGTATYDTKDAGTGKTITANTFVLAGAQKDNYSLSTTSATTTGTITTLPVTLALNASPLITKIYDQSTTATLAAGNYSLTGILGADAVTVTGTASYDTENTGVGKTITANAFVLAGAQKDNYNLTTTSATTTGNITSSALTLTLNATPLITKAYDNTTTATLQPANYTLNGLVGADEVTVSGLATYDTKDAGTDKTITANTFVLAGAQKDNYSLSTTTATTTGNITAIPLTLALNATPLITKVYDNTVTAILAPANYTLTGVLGTDAVTVAGTAAYDTKDAGTGKTITANTLVLAGAQKDNYSLTTTSATTTGNITSKAVTLALNASPLITKPYDNTTAATLVPANYTLTGVLGTDAVTVSGTANYDTKNTGTGKTITVNSFALAGAQKDNYNLTTATATTTGNITNATLTVALNATPVVTKVYNNSTVATLVPANYTLTGILGTDAVTVSGTAAYDTKDAGMGKTITAGSFVLAGAQKDNYSLATTSAVTTGNITPLPVTLALNASPAISKTYDGTTSATLAASNYTLNTILGSDVVAVSGTANYNNKNAATGKLITTNTFTLSGAQKDNYLLTTTTATTTGNITTKTLTVTADDKTKFQGLANPPLTYTYNGFISGEDAGSLTTVPVASTTATTGSAIGNYPITVSGGAAANYDFAYVNGTLAVVPGAPTSLTLAAVPLYENAAAGATAGTFSSTSLNPSSTYSYSLVSGTGDTDNAAFTISGDQLKSAVVFDYEAKSTYQIRVRTTTQFGLSIDQQFTINITDVNEAPTLDAIANQTICYTTATQNITLSGISAGPETTQTTSLSLSSSTSALFQNLSVSAAGVISYRVRSGATGSATVTVTVKDNGGTANGGVDSYSRNFVVQVNPLPVISITADKGNVLGAVLAEISKGETVKLTASGGASYVWSVNSSIISGQNTATLTVRPGLSTTYTVTATNASGCTNTKTFTLNVLDDLLKINATNILSPNGDGYNDKWIVENIDLYPNNEVRIFDKAGRVVYTKRGYDNSWDGMVSGNPLSEGTYYYIIDFGANRRKFKGFITIVREN